MGCWTFVLPEAGRQQCQKLKEVSNIRDALGTIGNFFIRLQSLYDFFGFCRFAWFFLTEHGSFGVKNQAQDELFQLRAKCAAIEAQRPPRVPSPTRWIWGGQWSMVLWFWWKSCPGFFVNFG